MAYSCEIKNGLYKFKKKKKDQVKLNKQTNSHDQNEDEMLRL